MSEKNVRQEFLARIRPHKRIRLMSNPTGTASFHGRRVSYGLGNPGGSDLIGYVTDPRTGQAIFTAVECKAAPDSRFRKGQQDFIDKVILDGGIGLVVHSANIDEVVNALLTKGGYLSGEV